MNAMKTTLLLVALTLLFVWIGYALGGQQAQALEHDVVVVVHVQRDRRLGLIQVREQAVDQGNVLGGFLVATACLFDELFLLTLERADVCENELGVDHLAELERNTVDETLERRGKAGIAAEALLFLLDVVDQCPGLGRHERENQYARA